MAPKGPNVKISQWKKIMWSLNFKNLSSKWSHFKQIRPDSDRKLPPLVGSLVRSNPPYVLSAVHSQLRLEWPALGPKWVRFPPNGTNPGLFLDQGVKMNWNLIRKSLRFVPFGANLTHFGIKFSIPGLAAERSSAGLLTKHLDVREILQQSSVRGE